MIVSDQKTARYGVMADPDWSSSRAAGSVTSQTQAHLSQPLVTRPIQEFPTDSGG